MLYDVRDNLQITVFIEVSNMNIVREDKLLIETKNVFGPSKLFFSLKAADRQDIVCIVDELF